jgi:hypothetical protein
MIVWARWPSPARLATCYPPPVGTHHRPVRGTRMHYCPGNRGVAYTLARRHAVVAAADGHRHFAGVGRRHPLRGGASRRRLRATYGCSRPRVAAGHVVARVRWSAAADRALYFGLRDGRPPGRPDAAARAILRRARLVPADGAAPRPGPPPVWSARTPPQGRRTAVTADSIPTGPPSRCTPSHALSSCGRFGAGSRCRQPQERRHHHGCRHDAPNAGSRCPLRAPDPPLEPEDEAFHLR